MKLTQIFSKLKNRKLSEYGKNTIHNFSIGLQKYNSDAWVTLAVNCRRFILCYFTPTLLLNKLFFWKYDMHKNLWTMESAIQNRSNLWLATQVFVQFFLNILIKLLKLNNDFKYFIYVCRILKQCSVWG